MQELNTLAQGVEDKALKEKLQTLENQLRASNQQQEETRDQAIRASLNLGAFLCTKMLDDGQYLDFLQKNYSLNCESEDKDPSCDMRKGKLDEQKDRLTIVRSWHQPKVIAERWLYRPSTSFCRLATFSFILAMLASICWISGPAPWLRSTFMASL